MYTDRAHRGNGQQMPPWPPEQASAHGVKKWTVNLPYSWMEKNIPIRLLPITSKNSTAWRLLSPILFLPAVAGKPAHFVSRFPVSITSLYSGTVVLTERQNARDE